jgi:hypothetical protein
MSLLFLLPACLPWWVDDVCTCTPRPELPLSVTQPLYMRCATLLCSGWLITPTAPRPEGGRGKVSLWRGKEDDGMEERESVHEASEGGKECE